MADDPFKEFKMARRAVERELERMEKAVQDLRDQLEKERRMRDDKLLNKKDAAEYLDISERTIYRKVKEGKIEEAGKSTKILESELDRYIREHGREGAGFITSMPADQTYNLSFISIEPCDAGTYWKLLSQYRFD